MAINATQILQSHYDEHRLSPEQCHLICDSITYVNSREESQALDEQKYSKIIISASGMITGGRILHHVKHYGPDEKSTILLTGYQAPGTRGARLLEQEKTSKNSWGDGYHPCANHHANKYLRPRRLSRNIRLDCRFSKLTQNNYHYSW